MFYKVFVHGVSDRGLVRPNNEDFWTQLINEQFFVLADGMGGHRAGEVASKEAVEYLCKLYLENLIKHDQTELRACAQQLVEVIQAVNRIVYQMSRQHPTLKGMGTTLCCVLLHPKGLIYGHVGDSRIYRLRNNNLEQLTQDHSLMRELIELGQLSEQQSDEFLYKNIITRAVGTESCVEPVVQMGDIQVGDKILLCTDGLTDLLSRADIQRIMIETDTIDALHHLVQMAKQRGGYDNITVVVIHIQEMYETSHLSRSQRNYTC